MIDYMKLVKRNLMLVFFIPLIGLGASNCEKSNIVHDEVEETDSTYSDTSFSDKRGKLIHVKDPGEGNDISTNIEAAWDKASSGDTILLPAGNYKYVGQSSFHTGKKPNIYIKGRGSGINGTRLYRDYETGDNIFGFSAGGGRYPSEPLPKLEISDIWFQAMKLSQYEGDTGTGYASFIGLGLANTDFWIHHCKFQYFSNKAIIVIHSENSGAGLISNNEIIDGIAYNGASDSYSKGAGIIVSVTNDPESWISPVSPGTDMFTFIEDNYFTGIGGAVGGGMGGLFVFRYNYCENNESDEQWVDMHPASYLPGEGNYLYSARYAEVYGNTFVQTEESHPLHKGYEYMAIFMKGGGSVIHNNTFEDYEGSNYNCIRLGTSPDWYNDNAYDQHGDDYELTYPIRQQIGWESGVNYGENHTGTDPDTYGSGDCFIWDNTYTNSPSQPWVLPTPTWEGEEVPIIVKGRDYHTEARPNYEPYTYPHPRRD